MNVFEYQEVVFLKIVIKNNRPKIGALKKSTFFAIFLSMTRLQQLHYVLGFLKGKTVLFYV